MKRAKTKKPHLCVAYRCKNEKPKNDVLCPKHRKRHQKQSDLATYTYNALKSNAKRRGKAFELTKDEFKRWCEATGYLDAKGRKSSSMSIDRIDPDKGYSISNIRMLSYGENSARKDCPF